MFDVILPCSGNSTRMKGINKTTFMLGGVPVAVRSAMAFDNIEGIEKIIFVTNNFAYDTIKEYAEKYLKTNFEIIYGGDTRQQSVDNGIAVSKAEYICIHDGARPFITSEVIERCLEDAKKYGGAVVCVPCKDTIKITDNGFVKSTPDRSALYSAQTPQIFKAEEFKKASAKAKEQGISCTDDSSLAEWYGMKVAVTVGEYSNIKITTPEDIEFGKSILNLK